MKIYLPVALIALSLGFSGCSDTSTAIESGAGYLHVEAEVNPIVVVAANNTQTTLEEGVPGNSSLSLRVSDSQGAYSHVWSSIDEYTSDQPLSPGTYIVEAFYGDIEDEGFGAPYFYGRTSVSVNHSTLAEAHIDCQLANTMLKVVYADSFRKMFSDASVSLHSYGGTYVVYSETESRPAFLLPGDISVTINLTMDNGSKVSFQPTTIRRALPHYYYRLTLTGDYSDEGVPRVIISFDEGTDADDVVIELSDEFIHSRGPEIAVSGFESGTPIGISEGNLPATALTATVAAISSPLAALNLTTLSPALLAAGWPEEVNLLDATDEQMEVMKKNGLSISDLATMKSVGGTVDFTRVIPNLRFDKIVPNNTFTLRAIDQYSKVSDPITLKITVEPVDLSLVSVSHAVVGVDEAEIIVESPSVDLEKNVEVKTMLTGEDWENAEIISISPLDESRYAIRFKVPQGTGNIGVRLYYCGGIRGEYQITRVSPSFTLLADPFALKTTIKIVADEPEMIPIITSHLTLFDGSTRMPIVDRDPEKGLLTVNGLSPARTYTLHGTVMNTSANNEYMVPVTFTTERQEDLKNGGFEDIESEIEYKDMLSGGRYSQSFVEIFNLQNRTTYNLSAPKKWADTNAKTFCRAAGNHNTWYMVPSVFTVNEAHSGAYAVELRSVAWDLDGEEIQDYLQQSQPFTRYSGNVPTIAYRAAGKLFIGSYAFDPVTMTETYTEGMTFGSRPSSLNGFYAYWPGQHMQGDCGLARIEVLGEINGHEETIAHGSVFLTASSGYKAFTIPLVYERFGVKATKLKVMFSSSSDIGDIAHETESIITTPDTPSSTSVGSLLWIDDITLSY